VNFMINNQANSTITSTQSAAKQLNPIMRQEVAISALASNENISQISREYNTSRKFVYAQKEKATDALNDVFSEKTDDAEILFHIPVTKAWLHQAAITLILSCHSSYAGVSEFFRDIFDYSICKGTVFNIIQSTLDKAKDINNSQDLSQIRVGAHDEIFQKQTPVLVGCDVHSTYTYLLKQAEHRDAITWGVRLLDLSKQGMDLDYTIADAGKGLRSGQKEAWPSIPCRGDVFHPLYDMGKLSTFLENRANSALKSMELLKQKKKKAKNKKLKNKHSNHLIAAKKEAEIAVQLSEDITTLLTWLKSDILSVTGPDFLSRLELIKFIVDELTAREIYCSHRIKPVRRLLELHAENLLAFVRDVDLELEQIASTHTIDIYLVRQVFELQGTSTKTSGYWGKIRVLHHKIGARFYRLQEDLKELIGNTVRASSMVENLNSRLRNYFFLRKTIGPDYLELLQFFLNHRRYMRSSRPERINKSPRELLTSQPHSHWLECLGYNLFKRTQKTYSSRILNRAA
jgi:hypothetical protein